MLRKALYVKVYISRGLARSEMGDNTGAKTDLQQAAALFQSSGNEAEYQKALQKLQALGLL